MGFFSPKIVDHDVLEWQFEQYEILIRNLSSGAGLPDSDLWKPIPDHFGHPAGTVLTGKPLAEFLFSVIKAQCGFNHETAFDLKVIETPKGGFMGGTAIVHMEGQSACGTYQAVRRDDGTYKETITIDEALTDNPANLIATLSHELAHALHGRMREPLDIEPELYELFTDLTAIYLGYGIFLSNSRFEFGQFSGTTTQGWQASGAGYLPEADMVMALAIFMNVKSIKLEEANEHLKPRLSKLLVKAFKQLSGYEDDIARLKALEPMEIPA